VHRRPFGARAPRALTSTAASFAASTSAFALMFTLMVALVFALASCGGDGPTAAPLADLRAPAAAATGSTDAVADDPGLVATTTVAPTSTAAPTTTEPATTSPPTVVQTLPIPDPPPEPRAAEPRTELGRLQIPKIGVDITFLQGISLTTLDEGPGHWPGTAMPGQVGNAVIAGHRTSHNKVFRNIDQLVPGDEVIFTTADGTFTYRVRETTVVTPDAMYIIEQTWEPTATLFACHPPGSTRERIVVHLDLDPSASTPVDTTGV
jgi:sortase A